MDGQVRETMMQNFGAIGFIDTLSLGAGVIDRMLKFELRPGWGPLKHVMLRAPETDAIPYVDIAPAVSTPLLADWPEAQRAIEQIRFLVQQNVLGGREPVFGNAAVTLLPPGDIVAWRHETTTYTRVHPRLIVPISTNPLVMNYCGVETLHIPVGGLWILNRDKPQSEINLGTCRRVQLEIDIARPLE